MLKCKSKKKFLENIMIFHEPRKQKFQYVIFSKTNFYQLAFILYFKYIKSANLKRYKSHKCRTKTFSSVNFDLKRRQEKSCCNNLKKLLKIFFFGKLQTSVSSFSLLVRTLDLILCDLNRDKRWKLIRINIFFCSKIYSPW